MLQNFLTIIVIAVTLCTSVACFAHPCSSSEVAQSGSQSVAGPSDQGQPPLDLDDCAATFCYAAYLPQPMHAGIRYLPLVISRRLAETNPALPEVFSRIFVPPQNLSALPFLI